MPGITGIISRESPEKNIEDLRLMTNSMMHEPFYKTGIYLNAQFGLYVGWVCHKNSFSDCMPVVNEKRDIVLVFSGENFGDKDVTAQLKRGGHEFASSNASYLIHMYEEEGDGFLQRLNGWFCGVLVDLRKRMIVLFNDRYGMGRIYYYEGKDVFYFSSEAKSLLRMHPELRKIDLESLGQFFSCGCTFQNKSLFSKMFLLPGGSAWTFCKGSSVKKDQYFKPDVWENQSVLEKEAFYKKLRETFASILPRYFCSRDPIAMSLTGGLDTRMILACRQNEPGTLPCYTFGGMHGDTFDIRVARKIAEACHQKHSVLRLDEKFFSDFPWIAEKTIYVSDGNLDVCGSHDLYLNRLARDIAPIRMSGKFGSELLRGASTFKSFSPCEKLFNPDFKKHVQAAERTLAEINNGHRLSFAVFKDAPWHEYGRLAVEQSQVTYRTPYMDNDFVGLLYQTPADASTNEEISLRLIEDGDATLFNIMTDLGFGGGSSFVFSKLAQLLFWFLFKAEWYYNEGMPHWFTRLDFTLRDFHPEKILLGHHKYLHYRMWFRDEVFAYVRDILLDKRTVTRPYLNGDFVQEIADDHIKGSHNYTNEINKTLTVELIQRLLIEQK